MLMEQDKRALENISGWDGNYFAFVSASCGSLACLARAILCLLERQDSEITALEAELQNRDRRILSLEQENAQLRATLKG